MRFAIEDIEDETLSALTLLEVRPAPDATRLAAVWGVGPGQDVEAAETALEGHRGLLRSKVAEAITRKKAPSLVFYVVPRPGSEDPR